MVNCAQLNVGRRTAAVDDLNLRVSRNEYEIIFIQEPCINKNKRIKGITGGTTFSSLKSFSKSVRATIWLENNFLIKSNPMLLEQFSGRDIATVLLNNIGLNDVRNRSIIISSIYSPYLNDENRINKHPFNEIIENLIEYCNKEKIGLIMAGDFNAHSKIWGDPKDDTRGNNLIDSLNKFNLFLQNKGHIGTYKDINGISIIDLTITNQFYKNMRNWKVDLIESFSDHRTITFELSCKKTEVPENRVKKKTDWKKFEIIMRAETKKLPLTIHNQIELDYTAEKLTNVLIDAYNKSCKVKTSKTKFYMEWYTNTLNSQRIKIEKLRKLTAKEFKKGNYAVANRIRDNFKDLKNKYKKDCAKAKSNNWKAKMTELEKTKDTARLVKLLENGKTCRLGSLLKEDGSYTNNLEESNELLMKTHFPECEKNPSQMDTAIKWDWLEIDSKEVDNIVNKNSIEWAISSFKPYKSPGGDGVFPALLQKSLTYTIDTLIEIFKKSLKMGHIPKCWREAIVKFIPKPGKPKYDIPKSFRPISLTAFQLKTLEKIIDNHIRETALQENPLNKAQHAYQKGKGCESALHELTTEIEKWIYNKGTTITVFIDIEGAFDNIGYDIIEQAATNHNIKKWTTVWINNMLKYRTIKTNKNDTDTYKPTKGCPQGGCTSPLEWNLVADDLINRLTNEGFHVIGYADDLAISISHFNGFKEEIAKRMNNAMEIVEKWCNETGLSVNPDKSSMISFSLSKKNTIQNKITLYEKPIKQVKNTTFLGIVLDEKLNWNEHINKLANKSRRTLWTTRAMVSKNWGINPTNMKWVYNQIIIPRITYGSIIWWKKTQEITTIKKLESIQRAALLMITGAFRTTPTIALEAILNIAPLHLNIQMTALNCYQRLKGANMWVENGINTHHRSISTINNIRDDFEIDQGTLVTHWLNLFEVQIGLRMNWNYQVNFSGNIHSWFADGSVRNEKAGIGIYNRHFNVNKSSRLSDLTTSTAAEIISIKETAEMILKQENKNKNIIILNDSQSALIELKRSSTKSKTTAECTEILNKIGKNNKITIVWTPKNDTTENIIADRLAKEACTKSEIEIITKTGEKARERTNQQWLTRESIKVFNKADKELRNSTSKINAFDEKTAKELCKLNRTNLRIACSSLTGHAPTHNFLHKMKKSTTDKCRYCKNTIESIRHIIHKCNQHKISRESIFSAGERNSDPPNLSVGKVIKFVTETKIKEDIWLNFKPP